MKFTVELEDKGKRLDQFLQGKVADLSRSQIQKMIKAGEITVDSEVVAVHHFLKVGEEIQSKRPASPNASLGGQKVKGKNEMLGIKGRKSKLAGIKIIKENNDYIVVNKPAGIVVHPDNKYKDGTVIDWLKEKYPEIKNVGESVIRPGIVHRLDKEVSGLLVVARNQKMFEHLKRQFQNREIKKEYMALVNGAVIKNEGLIKLPVERSKSRGIMVTRSEKGSKAREAKTEYEVVQRFKNFTLVKVKIFTGRTHQIRAHMKAIGHSIVGDNVYVTKDVKKKNKETGLDRIWLAAVKLGFKDLDGKWQDFEAPMPKELKEFLTKIN